MKSAEMWPPHRSEMMQQFGFSNKPPKLTQFSLKINRSENTCTLLILWGIAFSLGATKNRIQCKVGVLKKRPFGLSSIQPATVICNIPSNQCVYWVNCVLPATCTDYYATFSGAIYSPGYSNNYPDNANCFYYLDSQAAGIYLEFDYFSTESCCDHVTVKKLH